MKFSDLSFDVRDLIMLFQNQAMGSKPVGILGIATALAMRGSLNKINTHGEYGVARSIIIKREFEKCSGIFNIKVLEEFLNLVPFDFKSVLEAAGDIYALRYLQAYDADIFINSSYRLDFYIENNFSYLNNRNSESNVSKALMDILNKEGGTVSRVANLFELFMCDLEKANIVKQNAIENTAA